MRRDAVTFDRLKRCNGCRRVKQLSEFSDKRGGRGASAKHYLCKACHNQRAKEWYAQNKSRAKARNLEWARTLRRQAINAVCNGPITCKCCGEHRYTMLDIDHINGGGLKHRLSRGTNRMYRDMIASPADYQILCCNCNQSKRRNKGICEHDTDRIEAILCA